MKKLAFIFLLLAISLFTSAFSVKEWKDTVYGRIKSDAEKSFSDLFQRRVTIQSAGGILVGQIILKEVSIPEIGRVPKLILSFNPLKFVYTKGDIVASLTKITLVDGELKLERNKADRWNVLSLLPKPSTPKAPAPPPLAFRLVLKNCRVNYYDQLGFRQPQREFKVGINKVNGEVDLRNQDKLKFNFSARLPEAVKASGSFNFKTGKYEMNVSVNKINLAKWGNYVVPLADLDIRGGTADLLLKLSPPKIKGWLLSFTGSVNLSNASGQFQTHDLKEVSGKLYLADESLAFGNLTAEIDHIPLTINGRIFDFSKQNLDLKASLREVELKKLSSAFPQTRDLDIKGSGSADFAVSGSVPQPVIKGKANISGAEIYQQKFDGAGLFNFENQLMNLEADITNLYKGSSSLKAILDLSPKEPSLSLKAKFSNLNLTHLAQDSPGIEGRTDGLLEISGPLNDLTGKLSAAFTQASVFGQPVKDSSASFRIINGDLYLQSLVARSGDVTFSSRGKISRDLTFDLQTEASGWRLSGSGILGRMQATVSRFKGNLRWKMGPEFLAAPLKNLYASGEAALSNGQLGEQLFDQAQGKINIGEGRIQIEDAFVRKDDSILRISGTTGIGTPTRLKLSGEKINLENLKIVNYFLPPEVKDPKGLASLEVEVTGALSQETRITSFDPLLDLKVNGTLFLSNSSIAGLPVNRLQAKFSWQDRSLFISDSRLEMPDSTLSLYLESRKDQTINASIEGNADLSLFQSLTKKYGRLSGRAGINLKLVGKIEQPMLAASFLANRLRFNEVYFDSISGSLSFYRNQLELLQPVSFKSGNDLYTLSGNASFVPENPGESDIDLELKILKADLSSAYRLFGNLQGEVQRRLSLPEEGKAVKINPANFSLSNYQAFLRRGNILFYSANGEKSYFLKSWGASRLEFEKSLAATPAENLGGSLAGDFQLKGKIQNPSGKFMLQLTKGYFRDFTFDEFSASAALKNQEIKIEKALLLKDRGTISARGSYNFNNKLYLNTVANNMPLDVLQLLFPKKEFKGAFNLNADFEGPLENLRIALAAAGNNLTLAGINFDKAALSLSKQDNHFFLRELSLLQKNLVSGAYGSVAPGEIDLDLNLKGDAVGLINLFTNDIQWIKGTSLISAEVRGSPEDPKINGQINVTKGIVYVKALDSNLSNLEGKASIKNNLLRIEALTGTWAGVKTRGVENPLGLSGTIDLGKMFAGKGMVDFNLAFSPAHLYIAFPNLYTGGMRVEDLSLQGPFNFDLSQGPILKGKVQVDNALITISPAGAPAGKVFPLSFDLEANLEKNVYAAMGNVGTVNLSNILMNLEIAGEGIQISGNLKAPILLGKILIKRGTINIFNREFTLLSPETQKKYFPYDAEKIQDNIASFSGEEGPAGIMPRLNIISSINVENLEKDQSGTYVKKKINILARLQGTMGAKTEEEGLKIALSAFTEDRTKSPPEMVPAAYSEQDLKVMLLPDFIKALVGVGQPEEAGKPKVDTNLVLADYLNSWGQTILFRSLEREAEKTLGLESLTLEYNFGPQLREAMGVKKEPAGFEEEKPAWTVGFAKALFDRLYVDVRYSQGTEQAKGSTASTTFNYQLTYKISPIWSIIYYREPASLTELITGYQKVTLKAGFALW